VRDEKCEYCGASVHVKPGYSQTFIEDDSRILHSRARCVDALKSQLSAAQARIAELEARTNYLEGELYDGLQVQMNAEICDRCEELETQLSSTVSARDLTIRDLRARIAELEARWGTFDGYNAALHVAALKENDRLRTALETLLDGTRDPDAHGMGETLPVEYEMPPSTNKRVRALIKEALGRGK
jgi:chromosome segregation ATPase